MLDRGKINGVFRKSWPFVLLTLLIAVFIPKSGDFEYSYSKGGRWDYQTLVAEFSFPILKTQDQLAEDKERARESYVPYYIYDETVMRRFAAMIPDVDKIVYPKFAWSVASVLDSLYSKGVLDDDYMVKEGMTAESSAVVCVQRGKNAVMLPRQELYTESEVRTAIQNVIYSSFPQAFADSLSSLVNWQKFVVPNLVFDRATTENAHRELVNSVAVTDGVFQAGEIIVRNGEIVNDEVARLLDSYGEEYRRTVTYDGGSLAFGIGSFMVSVVLVLLLVCILYFCSEVLSRRNELFFVLTLYFISYLLVIVMSFREPVYELLVPFPVFALYLSAFFRKKRVLPLYVAILIPMLVFGRNAVVLFFLNLCAGCTAISCFDKFNKGWKQFLMSLFVFLSCLFFYFAYKLFTGNIGSLEYTPILYLFLSSLFLVAAYPLVYLFEKIFNLVSISRLVDLADTNNSLLQMLSSKAPGTFQHSLAVMNMAEAAGRSIDANVPLLRTAALYHDIGKTANPLCFVENQMEGVKYHENLSPVDSARDIIRHVSDGYALATKAGLPSVVADFIGTHHGTTTASYFLTKYLNEGGDPSLEAEFTYPGPQPSTREHAILMICDTLEAVSRTLKDFSPAAVSGFVDSVIENKIAQLENTDMTLRELHTVTSCLKEFIVQNHHGRIVYPKRNK